MKLIEKDLDKPITLYLSRNTIRDIMREFDTMGGVVVDNLNNNDKDVVAHDGIIVNCYPNIDDMDYINDEYTYKLEGNVISTFETRKNDSLVVQENNYERLIHGYDDNVYRLEAEFYEIHNKLYSAFPSYKIQCDGSIAVVEGSALENLKKLRAKQNKVKTR